MRDFMLISAYYLSLNPAHETVQKSLIVTLHAVARRSRGTSLARTAVETQVVLRSLFRRFTVRA